MLCRPYRTSAFRLARSSSNEILVPLQWDTPVLSITDGVAVVRSIPQERVHRTLEPIVAAPVLQITEDAIDVVHLVPQERVNLTQEQIVCDASAPRRTTWMLCVSWHRSA